MKLSFLNVEHVPANRQAWNQCGNLKSENTISMFYNKIDWTAESVTMYFLWMWAQDIFCQNFEFRMSNTHISGKQMFILFCILPVGSCTVCQ